MPFAGRRLCTWSVHRPERSASAVRFPSFASHSVSNRPIWLVDAAVPCAALPPTIHAHRRIASEPVGIVHVLVPGEAPEYGLSQHPDQIMPTVPARASISQMLSRDYHQSEHVIQFAIGQQPGIRRDAGTVELQLHTAVEIEPSSV